MNMSFYTGAAGAGQFTKKLSVVSNNLSNINNTGFKHKTIAFSELITIILMILKMPRQSCRQVQEPEGSAPGRILV